jgi:FKBP-type peptidyl-prolyl cis-trans isomerase
MENKQSGNISVIIAFVITIGIIGSVVYLLMHHSETTTVVNDAAKTEVSKDEKTVVPDSTKPINNNQSNKPMDTKVAKNGDTLVMNYTGKLVDGTVFDSNVDPKFNHVQPFEFTLGAHQVIAGWDEGLVGMKVGEKKTLTIPPEKGYGAAGAAGGKIPPNATLVFDVELVGIK